ncbi:MAG TPA: VCBS repeat-containing protein [Vicinamibacterales bacterium]|nr:VCBS repeat-containing protein [Vicinamibacterales bacterium]
MVRLTAVVVAVIISTQGSGRRQEWRPSFELMQPDLFSATGANTNAWADADNDGDLDYFAGFRGRANRFYRNDSGIFVEMATSLGLSDSSETRAAAWGDFDADGDADLYVGFADPKVTSKVYRNDDGGKRFVDVARGIGLALTGVSRQSTWIDYDGDGDLDFFAAFRDGPNRLFRNERGAFSDVTAETGIGDTRRTVSAVWWDFDRDGDVDLFTANQEGDANGLYQQHEGRFVDVAAAAGVAGTPRPKEDGGVGPSVADFDRDGDFDLFVANYGASALYRKEAGSRFTDVARALGIDLRGHGVSSAWGDLDNDGMPDLYVANFIAGQPFYRDALFINGDRFVEALPDAILKRDATHGVRFVDFDRDGRLDLSLTNNDPAGGGHPLWRNIATPRGRSIAIDVVDRNARRTRAGSEVRAYRSGTRELLAAGLVDSGAGYCSQSETPVHLGIPAASPAAVDIEIVTVLGNARHLSIVRGINPSDYRGRALRVITTR